MFSFTMHVAGIYFLFDGNYSRVCDANLSPGLEGIESCCNSDIADEMHDFKKIYSGDFKYQGLSGILIIYHN